MDVCDGFLLQEDRTLIHFFWGRYPFKMWKYICCQRPPGISPSFGCYGRRKADLWHLPRCSGIKCRPWWKSVSGYPIPDRTGISYRTPAAFYYNIPCHRVNITENTLLHSICHGETQIAVNSSHHQCVHIPAPGLVVSAVAPDGIIEAVEKPDYPNFFLGVQWHPEYLWDRDEAAMGLFQAFMDACK